MDTRTGQFLDKKAFQKLHASEQRHYIQMKTPPTPAQHKAGKVGRNDPCPCGSGDKFKRCCYQPAQQGYALTAGANRHERRKATAIRRHAAKRAAKKQPVLA